MKAFNFFFSSYVNQNNLFAAFAVALIAFAAISMSNREPSKLLTGPAFAPIVTQQS